jgi:hypothetical protein
MLPVRGAISPFLIEMRGRSLLRLCIRRQGEHRHAAQNPVYTNLVRDLQGNVVLLAEWQTLRAQLDGGATIALKGTATHQDRGTIRIAARCMSRLIRIT